jgi:hypothetical protein
MSKRTLPCLTTLLLCCALPAWGQNLPDGKGKEIAAAKCMSCHALEARVGNGYTAKGWSTAVRMMTNHGVPLSKGSRRSRRSGEDYQEKNKADAAVLRPAEGPR